MFSPFQAAQLPALPTTSLFIQQDPAAVSPVTQARSCFSCSCKEKTQFWPHKTRTVRLSESSQKHFEPNFTFYHQRKNGSKCEVHTCCINIFMCIYTHTQCCNPKPTARVGTLLCELRNPLCRVQRGENQYRGKKNAVFCSPLEMRVVSTFKPPPRPSPHKPNLSPCPPCGCWVSFCSLKRSPSSEAQRQPTRLRPKGGI